MTLENLRDMLRDLLFDKAQTAALQPFGDANLDRFINAGMHQVYNLARSLQSNLFVTWASGTLTGGGARLALLNISAAAPYDVVVEILHAYRSDANQSNLTVDVLKAVTWKILDTPQDQPRVCLFNNGIAVLAPPATATIYVVYVHTLPDMTADSDTPGQVGGSGTANRMPIVYHPLIASWAAVLALGGLRSPNAQAMLAIWADNKAALAAALRGRDTTSTQER